MIKDNKCYRIFFDDIDLLDYEYYGSVGNVNVFE